MADGKPFGAWLSGALLEKAEAKADGNASRYVKGLIERDVNTSPQTLLVELAKQYQPALADNIGHALVQIEAVTGKPVDGRIVVAKLLDALAAALADPEYKPEAAVTLVNAERLKHWDEISDERLSQLAQRVAEYRGEYPAKKQSRRGKKLAKPAGATGQPKLSPHPTDLTA